MGSQRTPEQLSKEIDALQSEVFHAKVHFDIFNGLRDSSAAYLRVIRCSPCFWDFTMQAHIDATVIRLCRIYDKHRAAFHLSRFLQESLQKNPNLFSEAPFKTRLKGQTNRDIDHLVKYPRNLNYDQLKRDLWFCSEDNPLVAKLRQWRDKIVAHANYEEVLKQAEPLSKRCPLRYEDLQTLIDEAFSIVNSYSSLFRASIHSTEFASKQHTDYLFVLKAVLAHLDSERLRREKPCSKGTAKC
jgi:hypothetical protein